jgi:hypothetical protein
MILKSHAPAFLSAVISMILPVIVFAQENSASLGIQRDSPQDLVERLNPLQKRQFDDAANSFKGQHFAEAFAIYKQLLNDLPGDTLLSKFAAEAALNSGDVSFALKTTRPLTQADPDDWQAVALLTRACAESGDTACRGDGIARMKNLHRRGITPPAMEQYVVERVKTGENFLVIRLFLEPWGDYKVYTLGQVMNVEGKIVFRATLESNDSDQAAFAKEHPEDASKGVRKFSLDGYQETGINTDGHRTQTHFTYKFFIGQPAYETVREEFLSIATGKGTPISSRPNLVVH